MAHNKRGLLVIRLWEEVYYELNHNYKLSFNITMEETWHSKRFPWNHLLVVNIKTSRWNHLLVLIFTKPPAPQISITTIVPPPSSVPTASGPEIIQAHLYERSRAALSWWELYSAKRRHICSPWLTWCGVQGREQCENRAVAVTQCPGAEPKWELGKLGEGGRRRDKGEEDENDNKRIKAAGERDIQPRRN